MIDPKNIVARYKGASKYDQAFQKMVQVVDALDEASQKIPEALDVLSDLKVHASKDPDVAELPGLNKHAVEQQIGYLQDNFKDVQKHIQALITQYEDSNKTFLRMKLR